MATAESYEARLAHITRKMEQAWDEGYLAANENQINQGDRSKLKTNPYRAKGLHRPVYPTKD